MSGVLMKSVLEKPAIFLTNRIKIMASSRPSSDMSQFKAILEKSKNVLILTGAGVSAESGIPTFRGAGGFWRKYQATDLATPQAFKANPSLVWEFYHYRRETARLALPNAAHTAITEFQKRFSSQGNTVTIVTQNIDNLHTKAGSENVVELHGNLYKTKCTKCKNVSINNDSPICQALSGRGAPDPDIPTEEVPLDQLPRCADTKCNGLLRPHIVWFGENLETDIVDKAYTTLTDCDVCMVIGTSSIVYPAAMFAPQAAARGVPVAEFNIEPTPATHEFDFYFEGKCGTTVPDALGI